MVRVLTLICNTNNVSASDCCFVVRIGVVAITLDNDTHNDSNDTNSGIEQR